MHYKFLAFALSACLLSACGVGTASHPEEADLTFIFTTDLHGQMLNYDFLGKKADSTSLSNLSTLVKATRQDNPDGVVLLDCGDILDGSPAMYFYTYEAPEEQHLVVRAMNYLGYDAIEMGNHDFECGESIYRDQLQRAYKMPMLCANAIDSRTDKSMFRPYTIINRNGFKIAVLGLITPETYKMVSAPSIPHLRFDPMIESARRWMEILERQEKPDYTILLAHAGTERVTRQNEAGEGFYDGTYEVARQIDGIDLVLMGHDHQVRQDTIISNSGKMIPVLQPSSECDEFGRIDMHLRYNKGQHALVEQFDMQRIKAKSIPQDEEFNALFQPDIERVNEYLDKPLGRLNISSEGGASLVGPSELSSFIHSVQLTLSEADLSMASSLSTFTDIMAGDISMRTLFSLYRYENLLTKLWMTGSEVKEFLEYGYGRQYGLMQNSDDHLLAFRRDDNGEIIMGRWGPDLVMPQYNYTSCGGLNYEVDVTRPAGDRVRILNLADGRPFDPEATYTICMTSFQAQGGGGYITDGLGWDPNEIRYRTINETSKDIRYFIAQFLRNPSAHATEMHPVGAWKVVPEVWWRHAKERDIEMLLPYIRK